MKGILILIAVLFLSLSLTAQEEREYDGVHGIAEIHTGWLIVRLPSFHKKLFVIDSLLQMDTLSVASQNKLVREMARTIASQYFIRTWYPVMFDSLYDFSDFAFIYDRETAGFLKGDIKAWDSDGSLVHIDPDEKVFFASLDGYIGAPLRFTNDRSLPLSYPFPNKLFARGGGKLDVVGFIPVGIETLDVLDIVNLPMVPGISPFISSFIDNPNSKKRVIRHVKKVNRRLHAFFDKHYGG